MSTLVPSINSLSVPISPLSRAPVLKKCIEYHRALHRYPYKFHARQSPHSIIERQTLGKKNTNTRILALINNLKATTRYAELFTNVLQPS